MTMAKCQSKFLLNLNFDILFFVQKQKILLISLLIFKNINLLNFRLNFERVQSSIEFFNLD